MIFGGSGGDTTAASDASVIKDGTTASFAADVIEASQSAPVLVDFWAPWCGPCKQLTPLLEKVVTSYAGKVRLVKINTDEHPAIAGQLRIQSLPTVYGFKDGRPLDGFMGAQPEGALREFIDRLLGDDAGTETDALLQAATEAFEAGDLQGAAGIFASILQSDQQNVKALAGLSKCYLQSGDAARAEQTIQLLPPAEQNDPDVQAVVAAIALMKKAGDSAPVDQLKSKVEANPADHQGRFDLAVAQAGSGDQAGAVDSLLHIIKTDRDWNDDAARKQLLEFFEAWGAKDKATINGRRKLSGLLFR